MTQFNQNTTTARGYSDIDQGLRSFMLQVYNFMAMALLLTGLVAYAVASPTLLGSYMAPILWGPGPLKYIVQFGALGVVMYLSFNIQNIAFKTAQILFWTYSALLGLSLSSIFLVYTGESVARIFFISASLFASMSIYGYSTKKDLSNMGSFLTMGLFGIIIASLVNLFFHSSALQFMVSILGVIIFTGLTAYDTQNLKAIYFQGGDTTGKKALMGALTLYLDFINMFIMLLQLLGDRRDR
jgi:FtsH-binding integral membrane protein